MTGKAFADYIRYRTHTDETTLPNSRLLLIANIKKDKIAQEILRADEDYFGLPFVTDIVAGQREYPMPTDLMGKIEIIEAKLDGINWVRLKEVDLPSYRGTMDENIIEQTFGNYPGSAHYDIFRNSLFLLTGALEDDIEDGLKIWGFGWPADLTEDKLSDDVFDLSYDPDATSSGMPRHFHELWARSVIIDYKTNADVPIPLTEAEQKYDFDFERALDALSDMNNDRSVIAELPSALERGNNGYNY